VYSCSPMKSGPFLKQDTSSFNGWIWYPWF